MNTDILVIGGGVIGTAIAWRIAAHNSLTADKKPTKITIIDHGDDADRASFVAAGMLAPVSESVFGEEDLLNLNLLALDRFPSFAREIERAAGQEAGLRAEGTLNVAYDSGDLAALSRLGDFRASRGLPSRSLDGRECRRLEPFLATGVAGGLLAASDLSVDNRRYTRAVRAAAASAGVETVTGDVTAIDTENRTAALSTGEVITATSIVLAAGHAARRIDGVPDPVRKALRPVKGQILRLRHPGRLPPVITHTVRALAHGREVYLVPRADGEVVVGATQEEREDRDITAGAIHDLLRDAMTVLPAVSELILAEASVGFRPGSTDNGPIVGRAGGGLIVAAGHFRNGILLSAATADAVASLIAGEDPAPEWAPFTPERLS